MQGITTLPSPVSLLLVHNLLGNMGPTIVKLVSCLDLDPRARAHMPL